MREIFQRVSIRKFTDEPVAAQQVEQLLRAAMAAPSAGNQQPWEFYVVTDREKIQRLAQCSPYAGCAANAPMVIVPCYRTSGLRFPDFDQIDLAIATENLLLEVTHLGLGAVWLAVAPVADRMAAVEAVLDIPADLHAFALVPLGHPAEEKQQQDRFDVARIHYC